MFVGWFYGFGVGYLGLGVFAVDNSGVLVADLDLVVRAAVAGRARAESQRRLVERIKRIVESRSMLNEATGPFRKNGPS